MKKENLVLFGGGHQVTYTIDIIEKEGKYNIIGIIDSKADIGQIIFGYPVIGRQNELNTLIEKHAIDCGLITIGDNWSRKIVCDDIIRQCSNFRFANAIHPSVIIGSNAVLGKGVVAMAGCIINTNATIGDFCFFATGAQIEHDCIIDDYASISAGTITGGKVHIGKFSAVTLGVTIVDRVSIGENSVIGSGSLVTGNIPANVLAYGSPAKVIRAREQGEKFLK